MKRINKTETLYEILNNKTFSINVYQREYRWGRKQIEQMINDLFDCFFSYYYNSSFKHDDTSEVAQYGFYFMGSIIRTGDDSTREIIDGQQRLTSLTLLLIYINKLLHGIGNHILDATLPNMICSCPFGGKKTFNINVEEQKTYKNNPLFVPIAGKYGIKPYDKITKAVIHERAEAYVMLAKEIWNISSLKESVGGWTEEEYDAIKYESARNIIGNDESFNGGKAWVIACNTEYYNIAEAFNQLSELEWQQHANYEAGDTVFIYLTVPRAEIAYKCIVVETNIATDNRTIDDKKFYTSDKIIGSEKYFKIKLLESYKSGSLTLEMLKSQGVKSNFQGPTIASGTLLELLKKLN